MLTANPTVFNFYLTLLDSFSEYLSSRYLDRSLDNPNHYKTLIFQKIVRMFHTLEYLIKGTQDEASARCVLRGILDSVITYCFIYQREDENDMMFRHYLYILDGFSDYKKATIDGILEREEKPKLETIYNEVVTQINAKLSSHPYMKMKNKNVDTIIKNKNWKYESLVKPDKLKFGKMYKDVGFDEKLTNYYHGFLSQFAHGLFLSNTSCRDVGQLQKVLFESIPIADRMVQGICCTFPREELLNNFLHSDSYNAVINDKDLDYDDLFPFAKAIINKNKTLYI